MMNQQKIEQNETKKFQAIVVAENPQNSHSFFCLLPCPIDCPLEITLQVLEKNGIQEIFIFASLHKQQIKNFISQRPQKGKNLIQLVGSEEGDTFAAVLRKFYQLKLIREDFILTNANLITDLNIQTLTDQFSEVSQKQKGVILLQAISFGEKQNESKDVNLIIYDKKTNLLIFYDKQHGDSKKELHFDDNARFQFKSIFKAEDKIEYEFLFNGKDLEICVCSKNLLSIVHQLNEFSLSKEYFLREILSSQISQEQIALFQIPRNNFEQLTYTPYGFYRAAIKIIKSCFTYFYLNNEEFHLSGINKFISKTAQISINSYIQQNTFVSHQVKIGQNVIIHDSIILADCNIDELTQISFSFIVNGCQIGKNVKLINCFLMEKCSIPDDTILENKQYYFQKWEEFDFDLNQSTHSLFDAHNYSLVSNEDGPETTNKNFEELEVLLARLIQQPEQIKEVVREVKSFWLGEGVDAENRLEYLYKIILNKYISNSPEKFLTSLQQLNVFCPLLKQFLDAEDSTNQDQEKIIQQTEQFCKENKNTKIHLIFQLLYKEEIFNEQVLKKWGELKKNSQNQFDRQCFKLMEKFLQWLDESDESEENQEEESEVEK